MVLGACYLLLMLRKVVFGPLIEPAHQVATGAAPAPHASAHATCAPVGWHEIAGLTPLMVLIVAIGVFPRPFLEQIRPAVARLDDNLQSQRALANQPSQVPGAIPPGSIRSSRGGGGGGTPVRNSGARPSPSTGSPVPKSTAASAKEVPKR
jgi:NADH-quinone oxidoreductase subunit M